MMREGHEIMMGGSREVQRLEDGTFAFFENSSWNGY
jgi:hypothetical protein